MAGVTLNKQVCHGRTFLSFIFCNSITLLFTKRTLRQEPSCYFMIRPVRNGVLWIMYIKYLMYLRPTLYKNPVINAQLFLHTVEGCVKYLLGLSWWESICRWVHLSIGRLPMLMVSIFLPFKRKSGRKVLKYFNRSATFLFQTNTESF